MKHKKKMDELEKNIPDNFWQKAFNEADETPPARVWDTIEQRLNESNGPKIIPLWGLGLASSRPVVWGTGIAAALALLLIGWWVINTHSASQPVTQFQPSSSSGNIAIVPANPNKASTRKSSGQSSEAVASVHNPSATSVQSSAAPVSQLSGQSARGTAEATVAQSAIVLSDKASSLRTQLRTATLPRVSSTEVTNPVLLPATSQMAVTAFVSDRATPSAVSPSPSEVVVLKQLTGKPLRMRSPGPIQRIVWFQPAELSVGPESTKEKRKKREMWASVSAMPGTFNPSVSVVQTAFRNSSAAAFTGASQGVVNSRASFSVAYQAGAGVQLTERWSVESGIGYLSGHSTVEAPTQSTTYGLIQGSSADRNVVVSNLYVDALRNSSSAKAAIKASSASLDLASATNAYISQVNYSSSQSSQTLTNDYQYVQVPVQVGYQLRPRKRLSLAVLGGLLTNIFVRNTVGNEVVITAKQGVYRPVSLAATMGARVRYRPSGRWSASLAGLYQPSLEAGTQPDSQVQSHPTSTGMSFGVDYHF